ncbi:hypothetical protein D9M69_710160 [compost metagenome]
MVGDQSVQYSGAETYASARHHPVRQRPAAGAVGTEESGGRECQYLEGLRADSDLQGTDPGCVPVQRDPGDFRWQRGAYGLAVGECGTLRSLAHH